MKTYILAGFVGILFASAAYAAPKTVDGKIKRFECGDNCYLTIVDAKKNEITGLCVARECASWNFQTTMPAFFVGKGIRVTLGEGKQLDGSGNVMGTMVSFTELRFQ